jgi:Ca-activated chloride channel family protein
MSRKVIGAPIALAVIMLVSVVRGILSAEASVTLEAGADSPVVKAGEPARIIARALIRPEIPERSARVPLAVALVLDKSGSMESDGKMENAKRGALEALRLLDERDKAALVVYDSSARVLTRATSAGDTKRFRRAIDGLRAGGNTALYDGVSLGAGEVARFAREGFVPRVVLLSDGLANVGPSSARELARLGREAAGMEITITTIGLGLDYDEDLMTALASESGGNAYFAKNAGALADIFRRETEDAVALTGRRLKVTLSCEGGAKPVRVLGREGRTDGVIMETEIENLYGAEKYAMFEIEIPAGADGAKMRAGTAKIEYTDAASGKSLTIESPLEITFTSKADEVERRRDAEITSQAEMALNAEAREEAERLADSGRAVEAANLLRRRAERLTSIAPSMANGEEIAGDISDFEDMAAYMMENGSMSNEQRKENKSKAYQTKNQQSGGND